MENCKRRGQKDALGIILFIKYGGLRVSASLKLGSISERCYE